MVNRVHAAATAVAVAASALSATPSSAAILANFYTVQGDNRDFGPVICCFVSTNEVLNALGPNGLPVYNPGATDTNGTPRVLQDHSTTTGELTWFTPNAVQTATAPVVTFTGSQTIAGNSYLNSGMFPPNGGGASDANGFQAAIFTGSFTFSTPQTFSFTISSDDDALLFVDGASALQVGGVHPASTLTQNVNLGSGTHTFALFYADRQQAGASLDFSIPSNIIITPPAPAGVPEPASWAMMVGGFGAVGGAMRRRSRQAATA